MSFQIVDNQDIVYVSFIVSSKGILSHFEIVKGCSESGLIEQEVIRVLSKMPTWKPAYLKNKPVNYLFRVPVKVKL
ncbi:MAG: energy transducer TonB [Cyclobacteriaceae bacterium]